MDGPSRVTCVRTGASQRLVPVPGSTAAAVRTHTHTALCCTSRDAHDGNVALHFVLSPGAPEDISQPFVMKGFEDDQRKQYEADAADAKLRKEAAAYEVVLAAQASRQLPA